MEFGENFGLDIAGEDMVFFLKPITFAGGTSVLRFSGAERCPVPTAHAAFFIIKYSNV